MAHLFFHPKTVTKVREAVECRHYCRRSQTEPDERVTAAPRIYQTIIRKFSYTQLCFNCVLRFCFRF